MQDGRVLRTSGHSADHALVLAQTDIQKEEEPTELLLADLLDGTLVLVRVEPLLPHPEERVQPDDVVEVVGVDRVYEVAHK